MKRVPEGWIGDRPSIDFVIVADRVEGVNGKLYMMGGGWDRLNVTDFNRDVDVSLAIGLLIPWNETNEQHSLAVSLEGEDGETITQLGTLMFQAGRPPNAIPGQSFRSVLAINGKFKFPGPGAYRFLAALDTGDIRHVVIYVSHAQTATPQQTQVEMQ